MHLEAEWIALYQSVRVPILIQEMLKGMYTKVLKWFYSGVSEEAEEEYLSQFV
jgi:hypothetical protein